MRLAALDGSTITEDVRITVLASATQPPAGMTAVGPVYDISPARPLGSVVVSLAVPAGTDVNEVVLGRQNGTSWEILGGMPTDGGRVAATVDHFSKITAFLNPGWSYVVGVAKEMKRALGLGAIGESPRCNGSNPQARATVQAKYLLEQPSEKDFKVEVCTERSGNRARLKIVNRRAIAVRVRAPQADIVGRTVPGVGDLISIGVSTLAKALGGNEGALIPSGGQIILEFVDEAQTFPMTIDPSGLAYSVILAAAGSVPGGWGVLSDVAGAIDAAIQQANSVPGTTWDDLARQGLTLFFKEMAKSAPGPLASLAAATSSISFIVLSVRGNIETFTSLAGSAFADLVYTPAPASAPVVTSTPVPPATQEGSPMSCPNIGYTPNTEDIASQITVTRVTCTDATALLRQVRASHNYISGPRTFVSGEYACTVVTTQDRGGFETGRYTCVAGERRVTWIKS